MIFSILSRIGLSPLLFPCARGYSVTNLDRLQWFHERSDTKSLIGFEFVPPFSTLSSYSKINNTGGVGRLDPIDPVFVISWSSFVPCLNCNG